MTIKIALKRYSDCKILFPNLKAQQTFNTRLHLFYIQLYINIFGIYKVLAKNIPARIICLQQ